MAVLQVSGLQKSFAARPVLRGVSLCLEKGERVALLGPSGCGKTTLLHCVGGIDQADAGEMALCGKPVTGCSSDDMASFRRVHLGMVFQFFHLLPALSAWENVELPLRLLGVGTPERKERVSLMLNRVGLAERAFALPGQMSGGEMQRVAIARALIHKPALILADEPTGNLDSATGEAVLELLREVTQEGGASLLMVTHSADAAEICHRVLKMKDGCLEDA
jgi:ABC-type lipoprotein export system ATPase subunit